MAEPKSQVTRHIMRKLSVIILVVAILVGVFFAIFQVRHHVQPTITGIGVQLGVRGHALQITGLLPNTPAAKAGLRPGLIIQQIDGVDIIDKQLAECVAMTRGPVGSKVQLEVIDSEKGATNIVEFTREKIPVPVGTH